MLLPQSISTAMSTESPPAPVPPPISPNGWLAYGVGIGAVVLDQLSKAWVLDGLHLPERFSVGVIPPLLRLTMVWNPGVSFGLLRADTGFGRAVLVVFAVVVVGVLAVWARKAERRITAIALGLVMGGALGNNLIDRLRFGRVADFIDVSGIGFFPWVFNVADSCITIGVILLLVDTLRAQPAPATAP
jgi:signal peptidase II